MPQLVLNGNTYNYPGTGEDPNWGQDASDLIVDIVSTLNSLVGTGDILESTFAIANNVSVAADITNLSLDTGTTRSAEINYNVYRVSTLNQSGYSESGKMIVNYDNNASAGNKWIITQMGGTAGVAFSITDAGQFQYKSTDIGSAGYAGVLTFTAKILSQ